MPEMVENLLGGTPQPGAGPTSGTASGSEDGGGESRRDAGATDGGGTRADKRIEQLVAERNRVREAYAKERDRVSRLEQKIEAMEAKVSQNGSASERATPRSWEEASDDTLREAIRTGVSDPDRSGLVDSAIEEMIRRRLEGAVEPRVQQAKKDWGLDAHRQAVFNEIQQRFGSEVGSEDSPLYRAADTLATGISTRYGEETLQKFPELVEYSFLKAQAAKWPETEKRLSELSRENERLKSLSQLEPGGRASAGQSDAQKEALQKGDVKGAIAAVAGRMFGG